MNSPIQSPSRHWWNHPVGDTEKAWFGASVVSALIRFGWMVGWSHLGQQNLTGRTYRISPEAYQKKVQAYRETVTETDRGPRPLVRTCTSGLISGRGRVFRSFWRPAKRSRST